MRNIIAGCDWRRLSGFARVEYRTNRSGGICIRSKTNDPPFELPSKFFEWSRDGNPEDWTLRTSGAPITMQKIAASFGGLCALSSERHAVDERLLMTAIACESNRDLTHPSGRDVRSPRTEIGYPGRTGEGDKGDPTRDAIDWAAYIAGSGTTHSSHGLMQTLVSTAVAAAPRFFTGHKPEQYRSILWDPAVSIECGASYFGAFPADDRLDPVRARFRYGAGRVYPDSRNRWGARMYMAPNGQPAEVPVILNWVAFYNDVNSVLVVPDSTPPPSGGAA